MNWFYGAAGSILIAGAAYWKGSLSKSGAAAAVGIGSVLYAMGSLLWFSLMIGFFVTSSLLTKWKHYLKQDAETVYQKSGRRDAGQVWANGGLGAVLCALHYLWPEWGWTVYTYIGVMATVTADTWATEVGGLSRKLPRSITTWKVVSKGTSGGVSSLGWMASACGGAFIGCLAVVITIWDPVFERGNGGLSPLAVIISSILAGWIGANADSVMGATVQALYRCRECGRKVESRVHCGTQTEFLRGWTRLDNDAVNMISSVVGGTVGVSLLSLL